MRPCPRLVSCVVGLAVAACAEPPPHRPIQMVPLPPPSTSPEPPAVPEPERPMPTDAGASSAVPQPLVAVPVEAGAPERNDLEGALKSTGWSIVGSVHTTRERGFEITHAEIRKPGVRGHVRLVRGDGDEGRMPHLPAGANPGVLVETDGMKGAESYFYDAAAHALGVVSLNPPGTRLEASTILRACFPFVH